MPNDWSDLLSDKRLSDLLEREKPPHMTPPEFALGQFRLEQERDHDRVLFCTPFRRMGDKTQVFPLESIESIRTRLTHSYEVANLARSLGVEIAETLKDRLPEKALRTIPAVLAAAGLAHDIGNPPFGHRGERAIRSWFARKQEVLFKPPVGPGSCRVVDDIRKLSSQHKNDFLYFDGNAQTLRVVTKLQVIGDDLGLNLTVGTLASLMKYLAASDALDDRKPAHKKVGFFATEQSLVDLVRQAVGLQDDVRHPLALIVEACDDIAYSVLDAEDAIKKGIVSFNDLIAWLRRHNPEPEPDLVISYLCDRAMEEHDTLAQQNLHPTELTDIAMQMFRVHGIHLMICAVAKTFKENYDFIIQGSFDGTLLKQSPAAKLCDALKKFDRENAFNHRSVLKLELTGYNTIHHVMNFLWEGITDRKCYEDVASDRRSPFSAYVYSRISKNYRRVFEGHVTRYHHHKDMPIRYREMQLLTDMLSGMTDQFCLDLYSELSDLKKNTKAVNEETS